MKPMRTFTPTMAQSPQERITPPWMVFQKNESHRSSPDSKTEPTVSTPHDEPTSPRKTATSDHSVSLQETTSWSRKSSGSFWNASTSQSLRTTHMDFEQDGPHIQPWNRSETSGLRSSGSWIWTYGATSTPSIMNYSWRGFRRKLRINAFYTSYKLCSMLATWRTGRIMRPTAVYLKAPSAHQSLRTSIFTNSIS